MQYIYLDNAATTQMDPAVLSAMLPWLKENYGNPSASHGQGRTARLAVENARKTIARLIQCDPTSIVFTASGTEAANTAIHNGVWGHGLDNVITSPTEHACVLQPIESLHRKNYIRRHFVDIDRNGAPSLVHLEQVLGSASRSLVCLMHGNNEMGAMIDPASVSEICRQRKSYFFCDMVQTMGHYRLNMETLGVDMASASAHKFHGPKGIGFLYVRDEKFMPLVLGGSQEAGRRAGTENVAGIVGMATALQIATERYEQDRVAIGSLKQELYEQLLGLGAEINGDDPSKSLYTVLNMRLPMNDRTESLLLQLDMSGVAVSGGSACSSGKASHVMEAMGYGDKVNIRFSFSRLNTQRDIATVSGVLAHLLQTKQTATI
jgi:cysteine desulfurase